MKRIKKGDTVIVVAGRNKGHVGEVLRVSEERVFVSGVVLKKHVKANPQKPELKSGIVDVDAPVHVSNVAHYNPASKKADKVGFKLIERNGTQTKVRFYKSDNELVDRI